MASSSPASSGNREEDPNEPVAKRWRMLEGCGTAQLDDQSSVEMYETLESEARGILNRVYEKFYHFLPQGNMWEGLKYLTDRLSSLKEKSSLDHIYIGLFGSTGAGKSSLLNAIIDQQFFLPVSGYRACTSCMVQVSSSQGGNYRAKIYLLSEQEWQEELRNLVELLSNPEETQSDVGEAGRKLQALYGNDAETRLQTEEDLLRVKPLITIPPSRCIVLEDEQAEQLSYKLDPYIRCHKEEEPGLDDEKAKMRLWPLIKYVEVTIPKSDVIPEGVVFVDIPGTGDYNSKRDEMWKENIKKCSVIWVISDIKRVQGGKDHEKLLEEGIKAYQGGMCCDLALVVTQSDNLRLQEYLRERRGANRHIQNERDAIKDRNTTVKLEKSREMREKLQRTLESRLELLQSPDLVYTVSAQEYWEGKYLTKEETEIPKLREYVRNVYRKEKKKLLKDYVSEVHSTVLMAKNIYSKRKMKDQYQQKDLESFVEAKIKALEEEIEKCFAQLEQPLNDGVRKAKSSHQEAFSYLLTRSNNQGFHRTLKAVCQKNGVYMSPTFGCIDVNSALAEPIYNAINPVFAEIFRRDDSGPTQAAEAPSSPRPQESPRASLKFRLKMFKDSIQKRIHEMEKNTGARDNDKFQFFIEETNLILSKLERKILTKKMAIYLSLGGSIQSELQPFYEEAAQVKGMGSLQRMQNILRESILKKTDNGMFEEAKKKMKLRLQKLKTEIIRKLQMDISIMFKIALCHWAEFTNRLPDFEDEYRHINKLLEKLKECDFLKSDSQSSHS
ncbi:nuclear GTPase SLIP-GC-like [Carettochelys insculpta]|uniref:nuclear GTPase SLIP-GC-like n=1 Tax=Carettochelys insculpta TaxID=44489 RepID=UPI003EBE88A1